MKYAGIKKIAEGAYFAIDTLAYTNQITPFDLTLANQTVSAGLAVEIFQEPIMPLAPDDGELLDADREAWLLKNKSALESVCRGMKEAEHGKLIDRGSFADHADDEIE